MGTRGLIGFIISGRRRGCYVQSDSYPEGMGVGIVKFILGLTPEQRETMIRRLEEIIWVESGSDAPKEIVEKYGSLEFHLSPYEKHIKATDPEIFRQSQLYQHEEQPNGYYALCRGIQGAYCLPYILDGSLKHIIDSTEFVEDGLFCEWAYWIDFEKQVFIMDDEKERKWNFDQLDSGFWGKLVDDNLQQEREFERRRKQKEIEEANSTQQQGSEEKEESKGADEREESNPRSAA
ncbi:hypothetical protein V865_006514 [Kwoniella europaea PYCC6329]|uniref:Uncharacterized protein n=1 Tax=Kwoniella europaea PYCC6329 TaxID=1423913 RepID=A0AAX4KPQ0_9TREE